MTKEDIQKAYENGFSNSDYEEDTIQMFPEGYEVEIEYIKKNKLLQVCLFDQYDTEYFSYYSPLKPSNKDLEALLELLKDLDLKVADDGLFDPYYIQNKDSWCDDWLKKKYVMNMYTLMFNN